MKKMCASHYPRNANQQILSWTHKQSNARISQPNAQKISTTTPPSTNVGIAPSNAQTPKHTINRAKNVYKLKPYALMNKFIKKRVTAA